MSCELCGESLKGEYTHYYLVCIRNLRAALAHERDRARRVVRVFWRVRSLDGKSVHECPTAKEAREVLGWWTVRGKVYRVTARRKVKL